MPSISDQGACSLQAIQLLCVVLLTLMTICCAALVNMHPNDLMQVRRYRKNSVVFTVFVLHTKLFVYYYYN